MRSLFSYSPLPGDRYTRGIIIQPAENVRAPVICSFTEINLDPTSQRTSTYEALSYVWGSNICDQEIICEEHRLLVTTNCFSALCHLRLKTQPRVLWVDAICINQKSVEERNSQVRIMGDIYKSARRVLIWLGEAIDETERLFNKLELVRRLRAVALPIRFFALPFLSSNSEFAFQMLRSLCRKSDALVYCAASDALAALTDTEFRALKHLIDHSWWRRTWTLQELLLAKKPTVVCGHSTINFDTFAEIGQFCVRDFKIGIRNDLFELLRCLEIRSLYVAIRSDRSNKGAFALSHSLTDMSHRMFAVELFMKSLTRSSTDHRDKIYGLRQILHDCGLELPDPDYRLDTAVIFEQATVALILQSRSLRVLEMQEAPRKRLDLPSWVPDFRNVQRLHSELIRTGYIWREEHIPKYQHGRLSMHGYVVGDIVKLAGRLDLDAHHGFYDDNAPELARAFRRWLHASASADDLQNEGHMDVFLRTLLETVYSSQSPSKRRLNKSLISGLRQVLNAVQKQTDVQTNHDHQREIKLQERKRDETRIKRVSKPKASKDSFSTLQQIALENAERTLCLASTGQLTLTGADAHVGDVLVLFPGATMPFILRREEDNHLFIGAAYGMYDFPRLMDPDIPLFSSGNMAAFILV